MPVTTTHYGPDGKPFDPRGMSTELASPSQPLARAQGAAPTLSKAESAAYDSIDRFLRNNLDDADYAAFSAELETVLAATPHAPAPVQAAPTEPARASIRIDFRQATDYLEEGSVHLGVTDGDASPAPVPPLQGAECENTGVGAWCAPGPADKQSRVFILRFEDADRGEAHYYDEESARKDFARAEGFGWNCHLFAHMPRVAAPLQAVGGQGLTVPAEQRAFEAHAQDAKLVMDMHPLFYLFLDSKTYAARMAWKAALQFAASGEQAAEK